MAADIEKIQKDVGACFDFTGKSVIHVGAGGGQFIDYAAKARSVIAVDPDPDALALLEAALRRKNLAEKVSVVPCDFNAFHEKADVVFFEFCLHEIDDPFAALTHARRLAPQTLVADHATGSQWSSYLDETEKIRRSWSAVERFVPSLDRSFEGFQRFSSYAELFNRFQALGEPVLGRFRGFENRSEFAISMPYRVALLSRAES